MNIAIVDDELDSVNMLQKELQKRITLANAQVFLENFRETLNYSFDICFIDIRLGEVDGIALAIEYSKKYPLCKMVFISNYDGLVYDALEANLFFFVIKSNMREDREQFYKKYVKMIHEENKVVQIINNRSRIIIHTKDIMYVVVARNHCYLHTIDNACYETYSSLTKILEDINSVNFCLINHHMAVNMNYIKTVKGENIILKDGLEMKIGRRKRKEFKEKYLRILIDNN